MSGDRPEENAPPSGTLASEVDDELRALRDLDAELGMVVDALSADVAMFRAEVEEGCQGQLARAERRLARFRRRAAGQVRAAGTVPPGQVDEVIELELRLMESLSDEQRELFAVLLPTWLAGGGLAYEVAHRDRGVSVPPEGHSGTETQR